MTSVAKRPAPQERDLAGIVAGDVEVTLYRDRLRERPNFLYGVVEQDAGIRESVGLKTSS